jgi:hypothetical protein
METPIGRKLPEIKKVKKKAEGVNHPGTPLLWSSLISQLDYN